MKKAQIMTVEDIKKKVRELEERYRSVFENTHEAIVISDRDGSIISANPAAAEMVGCETSESLVGMQEIEI